MANERILDGNVEYWWVTTLSNPASPAAAQINAGVRLGNLIAKSDGVERSVEAGSVDTTPMTAKTKTAKPGTEELSVNGTFLRKSIGDDAWNAMAGKPEGYLVERRGVPWATNATAGQKVSVAHLQAGPRNEVKVAENETDKFSVDYFNQSDFIEEATVA
ncbi:MAG: hypothetical protein WAS05_00235 [Candidatus Nanopelagicales bacterium]